MNKQGREKNGKFIKGRKVPQQEKVKMAEAKIGNQHALKLKSEEVMHAAYNIYCQWIASGRGKKGFVLDYEDENGQSKFVTWQSLEKYIEQRRFDIDPSHMQRAENLSFQVWEALGIEMMKGNIEKCQPVIYQIMMRNKFNWDKDSRVTYTHEGDAKKFMKYCDEMPLPAQPE